MEREEQTVAINFVKVCQSEILENGSKITQVPEGLSKSFPLEAVSGLLPLM